MLTPASPIPLGLLSDEVRNSAQLLATFGLKLYDAHSKYFNTSRSASLLRTKISLSMELAGIEASYTTLEPVWTKSGSTE